MLNQPFGLHYPATRVRPGMPWSTRLLLSVALIGAGWVALVVGALWWSGLVSLPHDRIRIDNQTNETVIFGEYSIPPHSTVFVP